MSAVTDKGTCLIILQAGRPCPAAAHEVRRGF